MSTSWLWLSIFQSGSSLLRYWTSHHITLARVFLQHVLSRFGACAKCLTDQKSKFKGEFQDLLDHAFIDYCWIFRDHPQADGLVERMVQTCKKGLRKICLTRNKEDWDLTLPYIAMGYRMSKHASLSHFSPYFLLFGRHPIPPSSIAIQMDQVMTWTPHPLGLGSLQNGLLYSRKLCPWPWKTCPLHSIETPYSMHTHEVVVTNLKWDNLMLVTLCVSNDNLMIL